MNINDAIRTGDLEALTRLLDRGAPVDEAEVGVGPPLLLAAKQGRVDVVRLLLGRGAPIEQWYKGQTALAVAVLERRRAVCEVLLERGATVDAVTMASARARHEWFVCLLESRERPTDPAVLARAVELQDVAVVERMISAGADAGSANIEQAASGPPAIVKALLGAGARPTGAALRAGARRGALETMAHLLDAGLAVDAATQGGQTALMAACAEGHAEAVELLVARGARLDLTDDEGSTAFSLAMRRGGPVAERLVDLGALGRPLRRPEPGKWLFFDECDVCTNLDDVNLPDDRWSSTPVHTPFLESVEPRLGPASGPLVLKRCPLCATCYDHLFEYDLETGGVTAPDVTQSIRRLSPLAAIERLRELGWLDQASERAAALPIVLDRFRALMAKPRATLPRRALAHVVGALIDAGDNPLPLVQHRDREVRDAVTRFVEARRG